MIALLAAAALAALGPSPLAGEGDSPKASGVRGVDPAATAALSITQARQSLVGQWQGKLEYRDYQADRWFGLPVKVRLSDGGDGVTIPGTQY